MRIKKLLINIYVLVFTHSIVAQISFTESSSSQNINVSHGTGAFVGGISFFDFNNDGWDDLTFASNNGDPIYFFQNNNGTLSSVSLNLIDNLNDTRQINWVDIDNDGDNDLFVVSNNASNRLYLNDGSMNFIDITAASGISTATMRSWGGSWGDYNNDGYLDLFLSNRDIANGLQPNLLYRNNGNNTFTDVSSSAGISSSNHLSFCAAFFDFNNDGWQDIYIANDRFTTSNILYKNNGNGTFTDVSASSGTNIIMDAMSTTIDDYNGDGYLDIYITNTASGNYFLRNNGDETFTNIASTTGTTFNSIAWGAVFLDADNDTDLDLYVSGMRDGTNGQLPSAFYENSGSGSFTIPANAGFANDTAESYSNAIGDINNDGLADISVLNKEPRDNFLWMNTNTDGNNWLKVTLEGTTSNRMGIGSWIEISLGGNKQYRYTLNGEGYTSQNSSAEFFGLGNYSTIDYVKVTWLSGAEDILYNVSANQKLHILEGSTLSIAENDLDHIMLYPNPSKGEATVKANLPNYQVDIFNVLGARVFLETNLSKTTNLNLNSLKSGVYLLKITSGNNTWVKKLIVK
ncbi:MAG: FG-GAP-like repeat-containing protein [Flavobacteriaceae bacterium]|nr:VCBS repeat-containing protein [Flavobacteriaceae bacterium]